MSCAARSISAVRMAERGTETRSETDDSGGLNRSAAQADSGQSSRHSDTMESTITCSGEREPPRWSVAGVGPQRVLR